MRLFDEIVTEAKDGEVYELVTSIESWNGVRIRVRRSTGRRFSLLFHDKRYLPKFKLDWMYRDRFREKQPVPLVMALTGAQFAYVGMYDTKGD